MTEVLMTDGDQVPDICGILLEFAGNSAGTVF